jgi:hypothetical protein
MLQAIKTARNKELGYPATAKSIMCLVLHYAITFAQIGTLSSHPVKIGCKPISPLAFEENLVKYILLIKQKLH